MNHRQTVRLSLVSILLGFALPAAAAIGADVFDRHTSYWLKKAAAESEPLNELSMQRAAEIERLGSDIDNPCLIVKTNEGNWAKALIGWGFRKGDGQPVPVLMLERFVTYRADSGDVADAAGDNVMLFGGLAFNFDIGQVVPENQGGDVKLTADGILEPAGEAELYALAGSQLPPADESGTYDPQSHPGVRPRDFSGTWDVTVDGRWKAEWSLSVDDSRQANGKHTSADTQSTYEVSGQVGVLPHNLKLKVHMVNTTQTFDAYLWTQDKSRMAGVTTLGGRKFGFYAVRQKTEPERASQKER